MTDYIQNPPTYTAIQWDGTNQQAITDLVLTYASYINSTTVNGSGALVIDHAGGIMTIPADGYIAAGPKWGGSPAVAPIEVFDQAVFDARFTAP